MNSQATSLASRPLANETPDELFTLVAIRRRREGGDQEVVPQHARVRAAWRGRDAHVGGQRHGVVRKRGRSRARSRGEGIAAPLGGQEDGGLDVLALALQVARLLLARLVDVEPAHAALRALLEHAPDEHAAEVAVGGRRERDRVELVRPHGARGVVDGVLVQRRGGDDGGGRELAQRVQPRAELDEGVQRQVQRALGLADDVVGDGQQEEVGLGGAPAQGGGERDDGGERDGEAGRGAGVVVEAEALAVLEGKVLPLPRLGLVLRDVHHALAQRRGERRRG